MTIKEKDPRRLKMAIESTFNFLNIVIDGKTRRKEVA